MSANGRTLSGYERCYWCGGPDPCDCLYTVEPQAIRGPWAAYTDEELEAIALSMAEQSDESGRP